MHDVHGEFGLINVHLFDILPAISSRKVREKSWSFCLESGNLIYMSSFGLLLVRAAGEPDTGQQKRSIVQRSFPVVVDSSFNFTTDWSSTATENYTNFGQLTTPIVRFRSFPAFCWTVLSPNSTCLVTSRLDTTRSTYRASRDERVERVEPCCSNMADDEQAIVLACTGLVIFMLLHAQIQFVEFCSVK